MNRHAAGLPKPQHMTREQHMEFCKRCTNRKFDAEQGLICRITNRLADFDPTCENFKLDETVKIETPETEPVPNFKLVTELSDKARARLRDQQDVVYAVIGGSASALLGALIWALVTVTTNYQIGYMAIAVGLLVGFAVRYYGAGVDLYFGYIGAFFALLGCALGNLFSQVAFIADAESLSYFDTLTLLNFDIIASIYAESFSPTDLLFYGIAAYEGYKFAFRNITDELINSVAAGKLEPPPYSHLRLPTVIVLFVLLSVGGFYVSLGSTGVKTFYYESGTKRSMGELVHGRENGPWEGWWENGKLQYQGFFTNGKTDSTWKFYDEEGLLARQTTFQNNLQHGPWSEYYANGQVSGTGHYVLDRLEGPCTYFYEDGAISSKGFLHLDNPDSAWETYYPNGKLGTKGTYRKNFQVGQWTNWSEEGVMLQQLTFNEKGIMKVNNTWSTKGVPEVINGNGVFKLVDVDGKVIETGLIKNGERTGRWKKFFPTGLLREEGEFKDEIYRVINAFTEEGKQTVKNGEGSLKDELDETGLSLLSGSIQDGLRSGKWTITSAFNNVVVEELNYIAGKLEGPQVSYHTSGEISIQGNCKDDTREGLWIWYFENGVEESVANFVEGVKEGDQFFYNEESELLRTEVYKNGVLIETKVPE